MEGENDNALQFLAQPSGGTPFMTAADSDFASWLVMSGDLLGSSSRGGGPGQSSLFEVDDTNSFLKEMDESFITAPGPIHNGAQEHHSLEGHGPLEPLDNVSTGTSKEARKSRSPKRQNTTKTKENSTKDEESDSGNDGKDPSAKRQRRLEKNREIARNCRKRKREKYQKLEEEVVKLRQYNQQLEKQLNKGGDGRDREAARKIELQSMKKLLENNCTDAEMKGPITKYKDMYSDFGRERNAAIVFHMSQLKSLLVPNTVSKMTLWSLQQEDEFYDEKKNQKTFGGGIWNMLSSELRFTDAQKRTLLSMRHGIRAQRRNVGECLRILDELDNRVSSNFESMAKQMDMVMSTITPTQQARFLLWIEQNKACTFMLNNMWQNQTEEEKSVLTGTDDEFDDSSSMGLSVSSSGSFKKARVNGPIKVESGATYPKATA